MRVNAGTARSVPLVAPAGSQTRPTADRLKGAIFNALGDSGCTGAVLDLFAGSGSLGIEALSRGAATCVFVDEAGAAARAIQANLEKTRLASQARTVTRDVFRFLAAGQAAPLPEAPFALILVDPPYALDGIAEVLALAGAPPFAGPDTVLVLEHADRATPPEQAGSLHQVKSRVHGDSGFTIYAWP